MKYKLVVADVDGTLAVPSERPSERPSSSLIETVKKVKEQGVLFSIASGRSLSWVLEIIKGFELKTPIILDNGARVYDCKSQKYIWESLLSEVSSRKVLSYLSHDKSLRVIITEDGNRFEELTKISNWKISKILVLGVTPQKAEKIYNELSNVPKIYVTRSISGLGEKSQSVHITQIDATKGIALSKVQEFLGVSKEETIAIGDSYNDYSLLMESGFRVAVENAVPEIKSIADYIAPSYDKDGVIEVLKKFVLK